MYDVHTKRGRSRPEKWTGVDGGRVVISSMDVYTVHTKKFKFMFKSLNLRTLKLYNKLNCIKL